MFPQKSAAILRHLRTQQSWDCLELAASIPTVQRTKGKQAGLGTQPLRSVLWFWANHISFQRLEYVIYKTGRVITTIQIFCKNQMKSGLVKMLVWAELPGERKGYSLPYCGLENSMGCVVHGISKSQTWLSDFHYLRHGCMYTDRTSRVALVVKNLPASAGDLRDASSVPGLGRSPGGGPGYPLRHSCLENPTDRGAWGLQAIGSHRVGHDWNDLARTHTSMGMENRF